MGLPLLKAFLTCIRLTLRPINSMMIKMIRKHPQDSFLFVKFAYFGQFCNRFETVLNRKLLGLKGLEGIPELLPMAAFYKGVDYFVEIIFYYGFLFAVAFWEMSIWYND